jgi:predicted GH43/DUF377 family glycosyl hydrolase
VSAPTVEAMVTRSEVALGADPRRVLARLFVPGHEFFIDRESRATGVLARVLELPEDVVAVTLADVLARYGGRHRDLPGLLRVHADQIAHRLPEGPPLSAARRDLLGAYFTHEFALEGAALCNPSAVLSPDQSGLTGGEVRFVLSLRAVGEGHLSTVEFRTGVLGPGSRVRVDDPGRQVEEGRTRPTTYDRGLFAATLEEAGADAESLRFLLSRLPLRFDDAQLEHGLAELTGQQVTRLGGAHTGELARRAASGTYEIEFSPQSALAERVLWPQGPSESRGMEDARFVRIEDADAGIGGYVAGDEGGGATYRATYTAFDGQRIAGQLLETDDFRCFRISPLAGPAARDKGMALFPRRVGGRHLAVSRWDRESCWLASSADGRRWGDAQPVHVPGLPWELIQTGNCGSPVETVAGWIVLTHGVGPMREYAVSALLLDLEDPRRVLGALREPLLRPGEDERDGYVPNVDYSCGPMLAGDRLLVPYGVADSAVRFAVVDVPMLVARLLADGPPAATRSNSAA